MEGHDAQRDCSHRGQAVTPRAALGLIAAAGLCWAWLLAGAGLPGGMDGMPMDAAPWTAAHAGAMLVMWLVMMTAMMLPSAAPMVLLYAALVRRASGPAAAPLLFALGYLAAWSGFGVAAVGAQCLLERAGWLSAAMQSAHAALSGALLLAAGLYQFLPAKHACLRLCQSPLLFLSSHWRPGRLGALVMGWRHGLVCVACCWALMLLLFVGGVMNPGWIAGIALFVLIEKLAPGWRWLTPAAGGVLVLAGCILLAGGIPLAGRLA